MRRETSALTQVTTGMLFPAWQASVSSLNLLKDWNYFNHRCALFRHVASVSFRILRNFITVLWHHCTQTQCAPLSDKAWISHLHECVAFPFYYPMFSFSSYGCSKSRTFFWGMMKTFLFQGNAKQSRVAVCYLFIKDAQGFVRVAQSRGRRKGGMLPTLLPTSWQVSSPARSTWTAWIRHQHVPLHWHLSLWTPGREVSEQGPG